MQTISFLDLITVLSCFVLFSRFIVVALVLFVSVPDRSVHLLRAISRIVFAHVETLWKNL